MTRIDGTIIQGDTIDELKKYHGARVIHTMKGELLEVPYRIGFKEKKTYGRIGDYCSGEFSGIRFCIPRELEREFADGWIKNDWSHLKEPMAEYYEKFAAEHSEQIIKVPMHIKVMNFISRHWALWFSLLFMLTLLSYLTK